MSCDMKNRMDKWKCFFKKQIVFISAVSLAVVSAFFVKPSWSYMNYLDFRVLALLFCLMFLVAGFREEGVFQYLGGRLACYAKNYMQLELILVLLCFFCSMLITNDVALITFVPFGIELLTEIKKEKHLIPLIVLQTIAANLGSMLTPVGNPQNLYLYSVTGMGFGAFVGHMLPLTIVSLVLLLIVICLRGRTTRNEPVLPVPTESLKSSFHQLKLLILGILFLICMGTVLRILPYQVSLLIVVVTGLLFFRTLFAKVDYFLLGTFAGFFIFVGNMQNIEAVSEFVRELIQGRVFSLSVICSQIISNVPATMLLSGFTSEYGQMLWGVNVGGLGTLIASLASLISYQFYAAVNGARCGRFIKVFTIYNILFLLVVCLMSKIFLQ